MARKKNILGCSFCGQPQEECSAIINGPGVSICDTCLEWCVIELFKTGKWSMRVIIKTPREMVVVDRREVSTVTPDPQEPLS